jgi:hypothetical protein
MLAVLAGRADHAQSFQSWLGAKNDVRVINHLVGTAERPRFRLTGFMEYAPRAHRPHYGLMLAARITLPHFSVSSAMNFPNSEGEL